MALDRPAAGAPRSIAWSVTVASTGAPLDAKLNGRTDPAGTHPSIIRWATERCGKGSSACMRSQPPTLRPATVGAYWSPNPRLWPSSWQNVSWISRPSSSFQLNGIEITPKFFLSSPVVYGPQLPMLAYGQADLPGVMPTGSMLRDTHKTVSKLSKSINESPAVIAAWK